MTWDLQFKYLWSNLLTTQSSTGPLFTSAVRDFYLGGLIHEKSPSFWNPQQYDGEIWRWKCDIDRFNIKWNRDNERKSYNKFSSLREKATFKSRKMAIGVGISPAILAKLRVESVKMVFILSSVVTPCDGLHKISYYHWSGFLDKPLPPTGMC